jgi:hypothetical protein
MPPQPNLQAYERRLRQDARLAKFSSIGLSKLARFALRRSSGKPLLTLEGVLNQCGQAWVSAFLLRVKGCPADGMPATDGLPSIAEGRALR